MISANGGLPAHRYTPQVTPRWPRGSEPASIRKETFDSVVLCVDRHSGYVAAVPARKNGVACQGSGSYDDLSLADRL